MKDIIKNLVLVGTLLACGLGETIDARGGGFRGGGGHGGGSMRGGGGFRGVHRTTGTSRVRPSGRVRSSNMYRHGGRGSGGRYYHGGGYGRHWGHRYPYRYGLYPWGAFLLTSPWWVNWGWNTYYANNPDMQSEVENLRAQLDESVKEMRRKDRRLSALEDRLDEALDDNAQAGLKQKISQLKKELRKQAEKTDALDAKLREKVGKD